MKQLYVFLIIFFLTGSAQALEAGRGKFLSWAISELKKIEKTETDLALQGLKQKPIVEAVKILKQGLPQQDDVLTFSIKKDMFYTEIFEIFEGDYKKAADLYWNATLGRLKTNLFVESGAGKTEEVKVVKNKKDMAVFLTDRIYKSKLAYNTKQTTRLRRFYIPSLNQVIIVNEQVKDWSKKLADKKIKKDGKYYFPAKFDLNIDLYQKIEGGKLLYASFSSYQGQGLKTPYSSLNVAKGIANIFSMGMINKGLDSKVKKGALSTWEKRKTAFQKLILEN